MAETGSKVVTTKNLGTFKTQMEQVVDKKVAAAGSATLTYATEQDILALFAETPPAENGSENQNA